MLRASEERHRQANSRRASSFAAGLEVIVLAGPLAGRTATVVDADYIESRVLIALSDSEDPQWMPFKQVRATDHQET